jgi:hypothetical protein
MYLSVYLLLTSKVTINYKAIYIAIGGIFLPLGRNLMLAQKAG